MGEITEFLSGVSLNDTSGKLVLHITGGRIPKSKYDRFLVESVLMEKDNLEKIKKIIKRYKRCCAVREGEEEGRQEIDEKERTNRSKDGR